jgi:hypothetical protein
MFLRRNGRAFMLLFGLLLVAGFMALTPQVGYAQEPVEPTPTPQPTLPEPWTNTIPLGQSPPGVTEVTFAELDVPTFELESPAGGFQFSFVLPYRWDVNVANSYLQLQYDVFFEEIVGGSEELNDLDGVILYVFVDETQAEIFQSGDAQTQSIRIPIPSAFSHDPVNDEHVIRVSLYMGENCDLEEDFARVIVYDHSFIHFEYTDNPLELDLSEFPRPVVQNLLGNESIPLVLPDNPNESDLSTAAALAATIGSETFGGVTVDPMLASEATSEAIGERNAIIIGRPSTNPFLGNLYASGDLPTTLGSGGSIIGTSAQPVVAGDGVLQLTPSTVSPGNVFLVVTGDTDEAVLRAARALSAVDPRFGLKGDLVVIQELGAVEEQTIAQDVFTLTDLGFHDTTLAGLGTRSASLRFFVPSNWRFDQDATLVLNYINSSALDETRSGMAIKLNDRAIGSVDLGGTTSVETQVLVEIPADELYPGYNTLTFEAVMWLEEICIRPDTPLAWVRIIDNTALVLPHVEVTASGGQYIVEDPVEALITNRDLSNVLIALPETPAREEWVGGIRTAWLMGSMSRGVGFSPTVVLGASTDPAFLEPYHVVAIGRPSTNPIIQLVNDDLSQSFVPGEDALSQEVGNVVYRLPNDFSIGLVEVIPSPWNPARAVTVVTGTTQEAVGWSIDALTNEVLFSSLSLIAGDDVESLETRDAVRGTLDVIETLLQEDVELEETGEEVAGSATPEQEQLLPTPTPVLSQAELESLIPDRRTNRSLVFVITGGLIVAGVVVAALGLASSRRKP